MSTESTDPESRPQSRPQSRPESRPESRQRSQPESQQASQPEQQLAVTVEVRNSLELVSPDAWNALTDGSNPFLSHQFLYALETTGCLGEKTGWYPHYLLIREQSIADEGDDQPSADGPPTDDEGGPAVESKKPDLIGPDLIAACPAYVKTNSYGEFVFDWSWADAYERNGLDYYPKLISAVPFTPATGQRLLVRSDQDQRYLKAVLQSAAVTLCRQNKFSSMHWLFLPENDAQISEEADLLIRYDCQYHWQNDGYEHFDDFLAACTSKRRKAIRRERRQVVEAGVRLERRYGKTLSRNEWQLVHQFYCDTFDRKWGTPSLTRAFFERMGEVLGDSILIVFAYRDSDTPMACAIFFEGTQTLYGRFWGCHETVHNLHFEACYYQGIDHAIEKGLHTFEPGAQGEHKIIRGFHPVLTRSAHWVGHSGFREAIERMLTQEREFMLERQQELCSLLPFRCNDNPTA